MAWCCIWLIIFCVYWELLSLHKTASYDYRSLMDQKTVCEAFTLSSSSRAAFKRINLGLNKVKVKRWTKAEMIKAAVIELNVQRGRKKRRLLHCFIVLEAIHWWKGEEEGTWGPQVARPAIRTLFDNIYTMERWRLLRLMYVASSWQQRRVCVSLVYTRRKHCRGGVPTYDIMSSMEARTGRHVLDWSRVLILTFWLDFDLILFFPLWMHMRITVTHWTRLAQISQS